MLQHFFIAKADVVYVHLGSTGDSGGVWRLTYCRTGYSMQSLRGQRSLRVVTNGIPQMERLLHHQLASKENSPPCISHKPSRLDSNQN